MLTHAWIIPLIPAVSFVLILAIGKKLPRGGSEIGIASVAICFVLALTVAFGWINRVNDGVAPEGRQSAQSYLVTEHHESRPVDEAVDEADHGTEATEAAAE